MVYWFPLMRSQEIETESTDTAKKRTFVGVETEGGVGRESVDVVANTVRLLARLLKLIASIPI